MPKHAILQLRSCLKPGYPFVLSIPLRYRAVAGARKKYFTHERAGKDYISALLKQIGKTGEQTHNLTVVQLAEIAKAMALLAPFGESILDSVTRDVKLLSARHKLGNKSVAEVADSFHAHVVRTAPDGIKSKHATSAKSHMKRFKAMFVGWHVSSLTRPIMARALSAMLSRETEIDGEKIPPEWIPKKPLAAESVNGFHRYVAAALEYGRVNGMVAENVMDDVKKHVVPHSEVSVFTPGQVIKLFTVCPPELVCYFAIGAFAGLRPCEIERHLRWRDIDFEDKTIFVDVQGSRTYRNRFVAIRENLLPVLAKYRGKDDEFVFPLTDGELRGRRDETCKAMELEAWPQDVLRHSFCSYNLKHETSLATMITEMGHEGPDMIKQRYMNPRIKKGLAATYCTINVLAAREGRGEDKIVTMPVAAATA